MQGVLDDKLEFERHLERIRTYMAPFANAFEDPKTTEIILNPDGQLWHERFGEPMMPIGILDRHRAVGLMNTIARCLGKELTYDSPLLEGEFPVDGSRFTGQIPPIVPRPAFTIRKKPSVIFTLRQYVESEILSEPYREGICSAVAERKNILVVGGTSSGKTTLTNAIIQEMVDQNPDIRPIIIEDRGEIQCAAKNCVLYHTTPNISLTDLIKTSLSMRPDVIMVGEVRDHSALDLLDAWNTGHSGGAATLHADSARLGLDRLRSLVSRNPYAPKVIEEDIGKAVGLVIYIAKTPNGRRVKELLAVNGFANGQYITQTF